ncbi:MAG: mycothiol system anti-sigma-R factor [Actinomycetota bacterium]|nr:mycothiol system anti-sigma-R factor [Actinomycetota bacterium]
MEDAETNCRAVLAKLYLYLDGEIAGEGCAVIESHLRACVSCLRRCSFERDFIKIVHDRCSEGRAPEYLLERIRHALDEMS